MTYPDKHKGLLLGESHLLLFVFRPTTERPQIVGSAKMGQKKRIITTIKGSIPHWLTRVKFKALVDIAKQNILESWAKFQGLVFLTNRLIFLLGLQSCILTAYLVNSALM